MTLAYVVDADGRSLLMVVGTSFPSYWSSSMAEIGRFPPGNENSHRV